VVKALNRAHLAYRAHGRRQCALRALLLGQIEEVLQPVFVSDPHAGTADVAVRALVELHERAQSEPKLGDVAAGHVVIRGDAHGSQLAVQAVPQPVRASAAASVPCIGSEEHDLHPFEALLQLVSGAQSRQSAAHVDDSERLRRRGATSSSANTRTPIYRLRGGALRATLPVQPDLGAGKRE
jgi:hypothetical protein